MLVPTTFSNLLIGDNKSKKIKNYNTLRVDFSKMAFIQGKKQLYTQCIKCNGILTILDKNACQVVNNQGVKKWICRFCQNNNQINGQLHFVKSPFKYIIQKISNKTKIGPPIMLFLIDYSGSMGESIIYGGKKPLLRKHNQQIDIKKLNQFSKLLKNSQIYKKQKERLKNMRIEWTGNQEGKDDQQLVSKIQFLYAIVEHSLNKLKNHSSLSQFRVGFIFFNKFIYILKCAKQKRIPFYVNLGEIIQQAWPLQKNYVNFFNFDQLFKIGKTYYKYFADSKLQTLDTQKINVGCLQNSGQTCLGSALALALGICSQHDYGSRIILVTDSQPNYGILAQKNNEINYQKISKILKQQQVILNILKWKSKQKKIEQIEEIQFKQFLNQQKQHCEIIQLDLQKCAKIQTIEKNMKFLGNLVKKYALGSKQQIYLLSDNKKVSFQKFQFDKYDYKTLRFLNSSSKSWIQVKIDQNKLQEIDFIFPVMTQIIVIYNDIINKQKVMFMSYVTQKIIKYHQQEKLYQYLDVINVDNIKSLQYMQNISIYKTLLEEHGEVSQKKYNKNNQKSIRINDFQIDIFQCTSINQYAQLNNRINYSSQQQEEDIYYL